MAKTQKSKQKNKAKKELKAKWEYEPTPDSQERISSAYKILLGKSLNR